MPQEQAWTDVVNSVVATNSLNQPHFLQISSAYSVLSQIIRLHRKLTSSAFLLPFASIRAWFQLKGAALPAPHSLPGATHIW